MALAASLTAAVARWRWAPDWAVATAAAVIVVVVGALSLHGARTAIGRLGPTVGFLAALLVLADGCRRAGLFDALGRSWRTDRGQADPPAGDGVPGGGGHHRGAQPRRHHRAAHPDRVRHRGAADHEPAPARLRVLAPGQQCLAAAAGLQPDQPAGVRRLRGVLHPLCRADGAAVAGGDRCRVGGAPPRVRLRSAPVRRRGRRAPRPTGRGSRRCP